MLDCGMHMGYNDQVVPTELEGMPYSGVGR